MTNEIIIAIITVLGTMTASFGGIVVSSRLIVFRIEQLEKKVEKHNNIVERIAVAERDIKTAFKLLDELHDKK
ncbi:MAG: hypothetical protein ACYCWE_20260 [Eubacteriales bacterium]